MANFRTKFIDQRGSGILMHISSLPGAYGIGDLGSAAYQFVDFLGGSGQHFWQFLPLGPSDPALGNSPYMSFSSAAGNPLFISPDLLAADNLVNAAELADHPPFSEYLVDYEAVHAYKRDLLARAFSRFRQNRLMMKKFREFCQTETWLEDYALFMGIRESQGNTPWNKWPTALARRDEKALRLCRRELSARLEYFKFEQFCFHRQWQDLRAYANGRGIGLIGDIPIYAAYDSVDVWIHQMCFCLNKKTLLPTFVAGVPPDYFSDTGQRWGNPVYRWKNGRQKNEELYSCWRTRFRQLNKLVDILRIDHFRGFQAYWQIPACQETAVKGRWLKGPGASFFADMGGSLGGLKIIAEDLGIITPEVIAMRGKLGFPGMKILQFAFDSDEKNLYLPHNFDTTNCVVYTGTHDNNTTLGWYLGAESSERTKARVRRYANSRADGQIGWDFIRIALASTAVLAIIPMQDVLGFGGDCRMNTPGTPTGNWRWRCADRFINEEVGHRLLSVTKFYGR
ncbi:MAG: 4-alpha-glucanotransferase [Deltaproteobacteria bacterium]|nr:4-alpha-glucanotransferase [Deltaproteobacteria bacterium]